MSELSDDKSEAMQRVGEAAGKAAWRTIVNALMRYDGAPELPRVALAILATLDTLVLSWIMAEVSPEERMDLLEYHFAGVERAVIDVTAALAADQEETP